MEDRISGQAQPDGAIPWRRMGNVSLTPIGLCEAVDLIDRWVRQEPFRLVLTTNVDHIMILQANEALRAAYADGAVALPDGRPVIWAARFLGLGALEKVSGSDLVPALCGRGAAGGWRVFFAGGRSEQELGTCLERIRRRFPGLEVGGCCPPMGFESDRAASDGVFHSIRAFGPDLILFACGSPKSEIWMHQNAERLGRGVGISIGAGLRFLAGLERRAPRWMQRAGLEWSWRMMQEPRRLWRRYLVDDMKFFPLVWRWKRMGRR